MPQRDSEIPELVGLTGAAALLGVSRQAIHLMYQRGELPGAVLEGPESRRTVVFRRDLVEGVLRSREALKEE